MVQVGDKLEGGGDTQPVKQIHTFTRRGVYAPFTPSRTIVHSGIKASTFVSYQSSENLRIGSFKTPLSFQWLARTFQLPYYWFQRAVRGEDESQEKGAVRPGTCTELCLHPGLSL